MLIELTFLSRLILTGTLTVVTKRSIPSYHGCLNSFLHGNLHELSAFGCVAHGTVKYGPKGLRSLQSHIVIGLIDDEFH